jgi:ubiquinone/menaquinone biosynthesis C-methylase UbiE
MTDASEHGFHFRVMALMFKLRDFYAPRKAILKETGIRKGFHVLDYGCGPGSYILPLADLVGPSGKIYALDIHPLAIKMVEKRAAKKHLANVMTIQSDCQTGLPDKSLDAVLVYDVFHDLEQTGMVLKELHRVLKPGGVLSFSDHHLCGPEIISGVTKEGFFRLAEKGQKTYFFQKVG